MNYNNTNELFDKRDFPAHITKLNDLYQDLFSGGKGFRAQLVQMAAKDLALKDQDIYKLSKVIEYIHNSSLLHDDLIDKSPLRRGKTAAWLKYSPEYAVLAGDYLLAKVIHLLCETGNVQLVSYTSQVIMDLLEGEWLQDEIKNNPNLNTDQMTRIHELKTASLKKWCLRAPFYLANHNDENLHADLEEIGKIMGLLFQRSDDLLDYNIRNKENKAILSDHGSGYMNSFAIFINRDKDEDFRANFLKLQSLEEIVALFGKEQWNQLIKNFDKENEKLIKQYDQVLERLCNKTEKDFEDFKPIANLLYWRNA